MTKLASVEDLRTLVRFQSVNETNLTFDSALEAATTDLESRIRTDFAQETRFDIFQLKAKPIASSSLFQYHWRLKNGFINSELPLVIRTGYAINDFSNGAALDVTSAATIDYNAGVISLLGGTLVAPNGISTMFAGYDALPGIFVRVDYTSGWVDADEDGVYDTVPDWLKQAAMLRALSHVDTIQPNLRRNNSKQTRVQPDLELSVMETLYLGLIQKHIRYFPKYANPIVKS